MATKRKRPLSFACKLQAKYRRAVVPICCTAPNAGGPEDRDARRKDTLFSCFHDSLSNHRCNPKRKIYIQIGAKASAKCAQDIDRFTERSSADSGGRPISCDRACSGISG